MTAPESILQALLLRARRDLFQGKPDLVWHRQKELVKKALLYPATWLNEKQVEIPAARYQAILDGILDIMVAQGHLDRVTFMSRYLLHCVQEHMKHHGDDYYREGVAIRNRVNLTMTAVEKARRGADATIPIFARADKLLQIGKRPPKLKPVASPLHDDLFAPAKRRK